ncbi:TetR/AcrR family transcriptional regulator [uncultured Microbacterium sp.]|uniref:TetR/AcrR family transcriptional regulator n=1 Tax=uncultured Microbacterium sp. TaxID=191216 RepID=UPI0035C9FA60
MADARSKTDDAGSTDAGTGTESAILDAALAEVLAHGIRRTTISDIARRCGIARQTLYRYWPDAQSVFAALVTRELVAILPVAGAAPASLDELVQVLVGTADRVRGMALIARLRETDPELLSRYILDRLGTSQYAIHAELRRRLEAGQSAGFVRDGDPVHMAAMVLLIAQSAVQSAPLVREWLDDPAWTAELGRALAGYLGKDAG